RGRDGRRLGAGSAGAAGGGPAYRLGRQAGGGNRRACRERGILPAQGITAAQRVGMSNNRSTDILIIGAGIAGLLTAWELARAGRRVAVLERDQPGREASRAAAGILAPLPSWRYPPALLALIDWSRQVWPALAHDLEQRSGLPVDYTASGLLYFHEPEFANAVTWAASRGVVLESLNAAEVARLEPALTSNPRPALRLPDVAQITPGRLLRALQEAVLAE